MSNTRSNSSSEKDLSYNYIKEAFVGGLSATLTASATFGFEKMGYVYTTLHQTVSPSLKEVAAIAWKTKFNGLGVNLLYNASYSVIMFPVKHGVENIMEQLNPGSVVNKQIAGFAGGSAALLATYPLSVIEAWRFQGKDMSEIMSMSLRRFYRGVSGSSLCDGAFYGVYFGVGPIISRYLSSLSNLPKDKADYAADTSAALLGGLVCNPLHVVATCQKTSNKNMVTEMVSLYKEGGPLRFYRGLTTVGLFSVAVYGLTVGASIRYAEDIYERRLGPNKE